jgi:NTE family protein
VCVTGQGNSRLRRGLVLGGGGLLGASWTIGALRALEEVEGWDPRTADIMVGTSAGAVVAALLASGIDASTMADQHQGSIAPGYEKIQYDYENTRSRPPLPRMRFGTSWSLFRNSVKRFRVNPMGPVYALLPEGSGSLEPLGRIIENVMDGLATDWPQKARCWVVATDYESGDRVVFGRDGVRATLRDAVMASCAIPGWYAPVEINGRRLIDGGAYSVTSLDLLAGYELDEVTVLAPMVSFRYDRPESYVMRLERRWRRFQTRRLIAEARQVSSGGTEVTLLGPGPEDLAVMGGNLMHAARRHRVLETSLRTSVQALSQKGHALARPILAW